MMNDILAAALSSVLNAEIRGSKDCTISPVSKVTKKTFELLNEAGYIGQMEEETAAKGGKQKIHLLGRINKCGVIKPRWACKVDEYTKFEKRYLPAKGVGVIIVSTAQGILTHEQAKEKRLGGRLLAYCY